MAYTVWHRGRLVGESELGYVRVMPRHRMGEFEPTELGAALAAVASEMSRSMVELVRTAHRLSAGWGLGRGERLSRFADPVRGTTAYADFAAATARRPVPFELRGPSGAVIPTEWIDIRDTEFLLSLARDTELDEVLALDDDVEDDVALMEAELEAADLEAELEAELEDEEAWRWPGEAEEMALPRYQLQVMLRDDADVP